SLKLVYQLTHKMMICPSKCRPLKSASTGPKGCILPSSAIGSVCTRTANCPATMTDSRCNAITLTFIRNADWQSCGCDGSSSPRHVLREFGLSRPGTKPRHNGARLKARHQV